MKLRYATVWVKDLKDYIDTTKEMVNKFVFRGVRKSEWKLKSNLERAFFQFGLQKQYTKRAVEWKMIREFRRKYDGADSNLVLQDTLYCMGLMRHHGAPTRLLDWTYSPYVAAFFALEDAEEGDEPGVWCIKHGWLYDSCPGHVQNAHQIRRKDDGARKRDLEFMKMYFPYVEPSSGKLDRYIEATKFVLAETPFRIHERHNIQQGVFLCPGDVRASFQNNLDEHFGSIPKSHSIRKIVFPKSFDKKDALEGLRRMNITRATLFPGLDGFACSLKQLMIFFHNASDAHSDGYFASKT